MRWPYVFVVLLVTVAYACSDATLQPTPDGGLPPETTEDGGTPGEDGSAPGRDGGKDGAAPAEANLRIMAANITSGDGSNYDDGEGIRMFKGLRPDVALVQELNYKTNSEADLDAFVTASFGTGFQYYREPEANIPNGIVSRYPLLASGHWTDPFVGDRSFAYAKIDIPGPHDLWAVSVHLLTTGSGNRNNEAKALVAELQGVIAADDYVVVGGDFNTASRTESCLATFDGLLDTSAGLPADQNGNDFTNAPRNAPYDWVLASPSLGSFQVPTVVGESSYPSGLVFDSRVYTPLAEVAPVQKSDSSAKNMQHMPVVKDFALPE